eukprot:scaffold164153_cov29-Tisochrysis_lutea.AAC.1
MLLEVRIESDALVAPKISAREGMLKAAGAHEVGSEHVPVEVVERGIWQVGERFERDWVDSGLSAATRSRRHQILSRLLDGCVWRARRMAHDAHDGAASGRATLVAALYSTIATAIERSGRHGARGGRGGPLSPLRSLWRRLPSSPWCRAGGGGHVEAGPVPTR